MNRSLLPGLLILCLGACSAAPRPKTSIEPVRPGAPARAAGDAEYRINALTLAADTGVSFNTGQEVRVVVTDVNPFVFDYLITSRDQPIAEASIADFFKFALKIDLPTVTAQTLQPGNVLSPPALTTASPFKSLLDDDECNAADLGVLQQLQIHNQGLKTRHDALRSEFQRIQAMSSAEDDAFALQRAIYLHPQRTIEDVQAAARNGVAILTRYTAALSGASSALRPEVETYANSVAVAQAAAAQALAAHASCPAVRVAAAEPTKFVTDTTGFRTRLAAVDKRLGEVRDVPGRLSTVLNSPDRFYVTGMMNRYDRPTDVTVIVSRRATGTQDAYTTLTSRRVNFGGRARFSFSAGLAAANLATRDYDVRVTRVTPPPANPVDTAVYTVVATKNSTWNAFPVITFNTRLTSRVHSVNPHLVVGVGTNDVTKPRVGLLLGLGVDALGERTVLTVGGLASEETRLGAGLRQGDRISGPKGLVEETSVRLRGVVSLTYRIF